MSSERPAGQATDNDAQRTNTAIFQASFNSLSWSGYLRKFPGPSANIKNKIGSSLHSGSAEWDAGAILTHNTELHGRSIVTLNSETNTTVPFELDRLPVDVQHAFNKSPGSNAMDNFGIQRVQYLYGDRQWEKPGSAGDAPTFRIRTSVLGDIINSTPVYVGAPSKNTYGPGYQAFFLQANNRKSAVYVGANDGMLHAFSADTGAEFFSYIPSPLLAKLPALSYPSYQHTFYMDGNISAGEAKIAGTWKTVLAAGIGRGAKGLFALDVTRPDIPPTNGRVMFEFTDRDDADIGYILSSPAIIKIRSKNPGNGVAPAGNDDRYFIAVPNGHNASTATGDNFLFLLSLDHRPGSPWVINKDYYKLRTTSTTSSAINALTSPAIMTDTQGAATVAYAGDLQGNVWRFDFSRASNPSAIKPTIVFTAKDSSNDYQPISATPVVSYAPGGRYLIQFGTGKYLEPADAEPASFKSNSFYTLRDTLAAGYVVAGRAELTSRILSGAKVDGVSGFKSTGADFTFGVGANTSKGWYIDFPSSNLTGERSISSALLAYGNIYFNTFTPGKQCAKAGMTNSYTFGALTGKAISTTSLTGRRSTTAIVGTPLLIQNELTSGVPDSFGRRVDTQRYSIINFDNTKNRSIPTDTDQTQADFKIELKSGRLSWREIQNWQDLK